jgi:hypothetical protein
MDKRSPQKHISMVLIDKDLGLRHDHRLNPSTGARESCFYGRYMLSSHGHHPVIFLSILLFSVVT